MYLSIFFKLCPRSLDEKKCVQRLVGLKRIKILLNVVMIKKCGVS